MDPVIAELLTRLTRLETSLEVVVARYNDRITVLERRGAKDEADAQQAKEQETAVKLARLAELDAKAEEAERLAKERGK